MNGNTLSALCSAVTAATVMVAPASHAQEWNGQVTLYGWGAGVSGDFTPFTGVPTLFFDASLSEVLEDLDAAFFATGLATYGDLVLFGDFTYSAASRDGLVPPGVPASGELTMRSLTLAAGRRFEAGDGLHIDVLGGLRAWSIDGLVSVPLAGVSIAPTAEFVDPIIAVRGSASLSDRWSLLGYVDLGGFGVGSELTWQAAVTANYKVTDNLFLSIGYRHLHVDYRDGGTVFDGAMSGPLLGATWRF